MNRVEIFIQDPITLEFESIKGKANAVSLTGSELLDERLDEARLVIKNSTVKRYPPLINVRIDFYEDDIKAESEYYVIGNPKSAEHPIKKD